MLRFRNSEIFVRRCISISPACSCTNTHQDHYKILGLDEQASLKDIKTAYYKLSKQHHPDTNPNNKEEASKKFHQVALAYEILGNADKRKAYDMTRMKTTPFQRVNYSDSKRFRSRTDKYYTDIDIDYKDFEHFQRSNRRRPQFHSHFDMPNEFFGEMGGFKKRVFKSKFEELHEHKYKDSRAAQREMEELRRQMERELAAQQTRYPIPTFEQIMRQKREKESKEARQYMAGMFLAAIAAGFLTSLLTR